MKQLGFLAGANTTNNPRPARDQECFLVGFGCWCDTPDSPIASEWGEGGHLRDGAARGGAVVHAAGAAIRKVHATFGVDPQVVGRGVGVACRRVPA